MRKGGFKTPALVIILLFGCASYNIPKTNTAIPDSAKESTVVSIDAANNIYLQDKKIEFSDLAAALKSKIGSDHNTRIFVRGDEAASYGRLTGVMSAIRSAGYNNIAVVAKFTDSMRMTIAEGDALKRQIDACWNIPIGVPDAQNLVVKLSIDVNPDRTVQKAEVIDQARYNNDLAFRAMADSALRVVHNPKCSLLELPPDKYDEWKRVILTFDPKEMT